MTGNPDIRQSQPQDCAAIRTLYPAAFPDEDLLPLVKELLENRTDVLSLIALSEGSLAGHVLFTDCRIEGQSSAAALLAPLAVAPAWQRQGIGGALVRAGLQQLENTGTELVCVLGDPGYYGRFGFAREAAVLPPYPLPAEWDGAWQSLRLKGDAHLKGALLVPQPWQKKALWAP